MDYENNITSFSVDKQTFEKLFKKLVWIKMLLSWILEGKKYSRLTSKLLIILVS